MGRLDMIPWHVKNRRKARLVLLMLASAAWLAFAIAALVQKVSLMKVFFIILVVLCFVGLVIHLVKAKY